MSVDVAALLSGWRDAFREASLSHDIVPLGVELLNDTLTPVGAFERFVGHSPGFLFESVEDGQRFGRFSFLGRNALGTCTSGAGGVTTSGIMSQVNGDGVLERVSEFFSCVRIADLVGHTLSPVPLHAGIVGVFGWDTIREIERLPLRRNKAPEHPDASLVVAGDVVAFDHWRQSVTLVTNVVVDGTDVDALFEGALASLQTMVNDLSTSAPEELRPARSRGDLPSAPFTRTVSSEAFQLMVREAKEQIAAGEIFQIVLSQRFDLGRVADPFAVYRVLRHVNPSAYLYYLQLDGVTVAGSSPEALVQVRDGRVTTRPIAGSRPRGENEVENQLRAASLKEDPKEIAEHIMLVDLGRNDVGRVSRYGSVRVDELMTVETYSHIMHLTSQVSGELRDGVSAVDVLKATFPAGTLSGAPKVRALELITEMEPEGRGLYGGAVGYFDARGNFDAAILIRTLVVDAQGHGSVQTGAGVVWDSDPASEDEECRAKAEAILRAVGGAQQ